MMQAFSLEIIETFPSLVEWLIIKHEKIGDDIAHLHGLTDGIEFS